MRFFLLPGELGAGSCLRIAGRDYHYLVHVLRLREGDTFQGTDGRGTLWGLRVLEIQEGSALLRAGDPQPLQRAAHRIRLLQCLPKGRKMDGIVRRATEAGVSRILPLVSTNSLFRVEDSEAAAGKVKRWQRIARQAMQQSGTSRLPDITPPVPFSEGLRAAREDALKLFFHQEPLAGCTLHGLLQSGPESIALCVGPEGGFTAREIELLMEYRFHPIRMGNTVFRTENASIAAIAAVHIILQERWAWKITE